MLRLRKAERLCSKKILSHVYLQKQSYLAFPLKVMFANPPDGIWFPYHAQMAVSVPKRLFKKAHDRNRIKRQMRNAYRLHKQSFINALQAKQVHQALIFVYLSSEQISYPELSKKMLSLLEKLSSTA